MKREICGLEVYAKTSVLILIIIATVFTMFCGLIYVLKYLSAILLPVVLVYIFSIVLRLPYDALNRRFNRKSLSFAIVSIASRSRGSLARAVRRIAVGIVSLVLWPILT